MEGRRQTVKDALIPGSELGEGEGGDGRRRRATGAGGREMARVRARVSVVPEKS